VWRWNKHSPIATRRKIKDVSYHISLCPEIIWNHHLAELVPKCHLSLKAPTSWQPRASSNLVLALPYAYRIFLFVGEMLRVQIINYNGALHL
jgi:hypothetical protein